MLYLAFWIHLILHPFHVGVYEIVYNEEVNAVQMTCRVFLDDLELAFREASGNEYLDIVADTAEVRPLSEKYFRDHFEVRINDEDRNYTYLGTEIENDVMWVYLEVEKLESIHSIQIINTILTEVYDDQQNIIHFKVGEDKKSYMLNKKEIYASYEP